jgi:hypothetical protein
VGLVVQAEQTRAAQPGQHLHVVDLLAGALVAPPRSELGLPDSAFVFCCMNGLHKLEAETFAVWMRILARTPGSVLWLADWGSDTARRNLARGAALRDVDPARLVFAPRAPLPDERPPIARSGSRARKACRRGGSRSSPTPDPGSHHRLSRTLAVASRSSCLRAASPHALLRAIPR